MQRVIGIQGEAFCKKIIRTRTQSQEGLIGLVQRAPLPEPTLIRSCNLLILQAPQKWTKRPITTHLLRVSWLTDVLQKTVLPRLEEDHVWRTCTPIPRPSSG